MARNFLVCLNLESAVLCSAEPLSYEESEFDEIRELITDDEQRYLNMTALLKNDNAEIKPEELPRLIREAVSYLGVTPSRGQL